MTSWAIDLGTSNTAVARWDDQNNEPRMGHFPEIAREAEEGRDLEVRYSIPSAIYLNERDFWGRRLYNYRWMRRWLPTPYQGLIGRAALDENKRASSAQFVRSFKTALMRDSYRTLGRVKTKTVGARVVATTFLFELMQFIKNKDGKWPRRLVFGTPVDSFEPYRAVLKEIAREIGVRKVGFVDEPVAAALGYGLSIRDDRPVLVIDFGAGTLDLALIRMTKNKSEKIGACEVLAKEGLVLGGNHVDAWLFEKFAAEKGYQLQGINELVAQWWYNAMLAEACRVKERLFFEEETFFSLEPPEQLRSLDAILQMQGGPRRDPVEVSRTDLIDLLDEKGLYNSLKDAIRTIERQASRHGIAAKDIGEVLMVGGSTLLPQVYSVVEQHFGRDRVRAWQPFFAVAYGASVFADGGRRTSDFITHDYAIQIFDTAAKQKAYQTIVPAGTHFPTPKDFNKQFFVPTCAGGEPEDLFRLVICELGRHRQEVDEFVWDAQGKLHKAGDDTEPGGRLVIPLNEQDPTLGRLDPPHQPSDRKARLEIAFGINEDRWLIATVTDIKTNKVLMKERAVVRLK